MTPSVNGPALGHPFQAIPAGKRAAVFVPVLALTIALLIALQVVNRPLTTSAAPQGIITYELVGNTAGAQRIIDSWASLNARLHAGLSLGLDFLYMPSYAIAIALACAWLAQGLGGRQAWAGTIGVLLAWGQGPAGLLDATENVALISMLGSGVAAAPWPQIAFWCAAVKFSLVIGGLVYAAIGAIAWLAGRK